MGPKKIKNLLVSAATMLLILSMAGYIYTHAGDFALIRNLSLPYVILSIVCSVATILSGYLFIKISMQALGVHLDYVEWIGVPALSNLIGIFLPMRADLLIKGVYYKKKCGLSYSKYLSITAGSLFIMLCVYIVELILCLSIWGRQREEAIFLLYVSGILLAGLVCFLVFLRYQKELLLRYIPMKQYSRPILLGFYDLLNTKGVIKACVGTVLLSNIWGISRLIILAHGVGITCRFFQAILYYVIYQISGLFSILPGNIGITESLFGVAAIATGGLFQNGMLLSLLARTVGILSYLLLTLIFLPAVIRRLRQQ